MQSPRPDGDPNPAAPGEEVGDTPAAAGQHPGMPPKIDAAHTGKPSTEKLARGARPQRSDKGSLNDRNVAGDSGAREPKSR